jgi:hypothetical protein
MKSASSSSASPVLASDTVTVGGSMKSSARRARRISWRASGVRPAACTVPASGTVIMPSGRTSTSRLSELSSRTEISSTSPGLST